MHNKVITFGIVGAGYVATHVHLPILSDFKEARVVAICDTDEKKAHRIAEVFKIPKVYINFVEMLEKEDLDVIAILTPPSTHADIAICALRSGYNCLIEKPLATKVTDADEVIRVAQEEKRALHVIHNFSFMPCMRKAKDIFSRSDIGELVSVDVRYLTSPKLEMQRYFDPTHWCHYLPGGIFSDLAPHLVMLLLDFLEDVYKVKVMTKKLSNYRYIAADELKVMVEAKNSLGSLAISFNSPVRCVSVDMRARVLKPILHMLWVIAGVFTYNKPTYAGHMVFQKN